MTTLTLGELCAGYNGLGMAVEAALNATPAWFSEYEAAPSKILTHHYPDVPNYGDMTKIDWAAIEHVDIISGGTPCQDLSAAGRRAGMNEGTRSNLWVQMREAVAIQKPKWVVWENVRGAFSACASSEMGQCPGCVDGRGAHKPFLRALGRVLGDLSDLGYDCQWRGLRAADVGACHGRFRVFVLARRNDVRNAAGSHVEGQRAGGIEVAHVAPEPRERRSASANASHADRLGHERPRDARGRWTRLEDGGEPAPDAWSDGRKRNGPGTVRGSAENWRSSASRDRHSPAVRDVNWGDYAHAIRRWERVIGRPAPRPTEPTGRNNGHRLSPRFTEWMMGLPDGWVTDPAIGISRNEQLKACGNGVVPQQAYAALTDMLTKFNQLDQEAV